MPGGGLGLIGFTEIVAILSLLVAFAGVALNGFGRRQDSNDHLTQQAQWHAKVDTKLDNIKEINDRVDRNLEKLDSSIKQLSKDHVAVEGRVTRLERRVESLEKKITDLNEAVIGEVALSEAERKK